MKKYKFFESLTIGQKPDIVIPVACAVIMRIEDGQQQILVIQRSKDDRWPLHWELPRGKCDKPPGEKIEHCLKREVKEETGLEVDIIKFIDKFEYLADRGTRKSISYNFLCKMTTPAQRVQLSNEHDDYKWISSVGEVELMVVPDQKKTITKVLDTDEKIVNYPSNDFTKNNKIEEYLKVLQND